MSGLAFHKRRAVALSNRWLPVPIAEAAVSAAVGSAGRGGRITCGGKVQPWRSAPARPARLGGAAATRASPMRAGGPSGGLPALEDGLLQQQAVPLFSMCCSKGNEGLLRWEPAGSTEAPCEPGGVRCWPPCLCCARALPGAGLGHGGLAWPGHSSWGRQGDGCFCFVTICSHIPCDSLGMRNTSILTLRAVGSRVGCINFEQGCAFSSWRRSV